MRTPAADEQELRRRKESVELCGKNRGPHYYIPIEWEVNKNCKKVTKLLCRICFCQVDVKVLLEYNPLVSY